MADELSPKPPGLDAAGGRSKRRGRAIPPARRAGRAFQPEGEILLQTCCRCSDRRSPIQLTRAFEVERFDGDFELMHYPPVAALDGLREPK